MTAVVASLLLASIAHANVLPREMGASSSVLTSSNLSTLSRSTSVIFDSFTTSLSSSSIALTSDDIVFPIPTLTTPSFPTTAASAFPGTISVPLPPQADYLTTTIPACTLADGRPVDSLVVLGIPTGTFTAGTKTIVVPPQANPTKLVYTDNVLNATEVFIIKPLEGTCLDPAEFAPSRTSNPDDESPSATAAPDACPTKGCTGAVIKTAETVINAINKVTLLSQNLQAAARRIGATLFPQQGEDADTFFAQGPIVDVTVGFGRITVSLQTDAPRFITLPPFPPSCSADTILIAWIEFVRVHQELLNILIGRAGLLDQGPIKRAHGGNYPRDQGKFTGPELWDRGTAGFIGKPIAAALRTLESIVDTVALKLVELVPSNDECTAQKTAELKKSIKEAQVAYDGPS